jgi:hypothetical protein
MFFVRNPSPHISSHRLRSAYISLKAVANGVLLDAYTRTVPIQASRKDRSPSTTYSRSRNTYDYDHGRRTSSQVQYEFLTYIHQCSRSNVTVLDVYVLAILLTLGGQDRTQSRKSAVPWTQERAEHRKIQDEVTDLKIGRKC